MAILRPSTRRKPPPSPKRWSNAWQTRKRISECTCGRATPFEVGALGCD